MRELEGYRDNLEDILAFFNDKRMLSVKDVKRYTGLKDYYAIKKRFPFMEGGYISAVTLARCMAGGSTGN